MRLLLVIVVGLAACGGGASNDDMDMALAPTGTCPEGVALVEKGYKWTTSAMLDGKGPYTFVIDTGAPSSVIDKSLGASGDHTISALGQERTVSATSFALAPTGLSADGVIGTDFFGDQVLTFDPQRGRVWLTPTLAEDDLRACAHASTTASSTSFEMNNYLFVDGSVDGVAGRLLLDTGATFGLVDNAAFATMNAQEPRPYLSGFYTQAAAGTFWSNLTTLGTITVGTASVHHVLSRTGDFSKISTGLDAQALVPLGFFRHFLVTFDYPAQKLRLAPYVGDTLTDAVQRYAVGIGLNESVNPPITVASVLVVSDAHDQGVQVGDEVIAIGGKAIASIAAASRGWALTSSTNGAKIAVTLQRGAQTLDLQLEARDVLTAP